MALKDKYGRIIDYLRLAVTDRCNLRCFYCMPESGIDYMAKEELLSYEEMSRIINILYQEGISKVRITGGEPFLRKDLMPFLQQISQNEKLEICITTNGTLTSQHLEELYNLGIKKINLSLDALDPTLFYQITKRDEFHVVKTCLDQMLTLGFDLKINMVVMNGINDHQILPMCQLAKDDNISVRFLEEMPFNGGRTLGSEFMDHTKILKCIRSHFPDIDQLPTPPNSTSVDYKINGYKGSIGIIASHSRSFCGTCNRLRITPQGTLKTCLYDSGVFDLKQLIRLGATDLEILNAIQSAISHKAKDGFVAEEQANSLLFRESMASIGG